MKAFLSAASALCFLMNTLTCVCIPHFYSGPFWSSLNDEELLSVSTHSHLEVVIPFIQHEY